MTFTEVVDGQQLAERQDRSEQYAALPERSRERRAGAGGRGCAWTIGIGKFYQGDDADAGAAGLRGGGAESVSPRSARLQRRQYDAQGAAARCDDRERHRRGDQISQEPL